MSSPSVDHIFLTRSSVVDPFKPAAVVCSLFSFSFFFPLSLLVSPERTQLNGCFYVRVARQLLLAGSQPEFDDAPVRGDTALSRVRARAPSHREKIRGPEDPSPMEPFFLLPTIPPRPLRGEMKNKKQSGR